MNAEKANPEIPVEIGGQLYTLVYGLRAMIELEKKTGKNPLGNQFWESMGPGDLAVLLWAGLLKNHKLTLDKVIDMVDSMAELGAMFASMQRAFEVAQPTAEDLEKKTARSGGPKLENQTDQPASTG